MPIEMRNPLNEGQDYIPATTSGLGGRCGRMFSALNEGQDYIPATTIVLSQVLIKRCTLNEGQDYIPATTSLERPSNYGLHTLAQ